MVLDGSERSPGPPDHSPGLCRAIRSTLTASFRPKATCSSRGVLAAPPIPTWCCAPNQASKASSTPSMGPTPSRCSLRAAKPRSSSGSHARAPILKWCGLIEAATRSRGLPIRASSGASHPLPKQSSPTRWPPRRSPSQLVSPRAIRPREMLPFSSTRARTAWPASTRAAAPLRG